jgi:hypothetical protein
MPRTCKLVNPLKTANILALSMLAGPVLAQSDNEIPSGFKPDRYQKVWEHNPFTLVAPAVAQAQPSLFDKLVLLSWLDDGGQDVVFVQNTETNAVQKVTKESGADNLKLLEVHVDPDPRKVEVVLSHGAERGIVKFRTENPAALAQAPGSSAPGGIRNPGGFPGAQPLPGMRGQTQVPQNPLEAFQQAARTGPVQPQQGGVPGQGEAGLRPPRASEIRRKRVTAPPVTEQPVSPQQLVSPQQPVNPQQPFQNPANQQPQGQ